MDHPVYIFTCFLWSGVFVGISKPERAVEKALLYSTPKNQTDPSVCVWGG